MLSIRLFQQGYAQSNPPSVKSLIERPWIQVHT